MCAQGVWWNFRANLQYYPSINRQWPSAVAGSVPPLFTAIKWSDVICHTSGRHCLGHTCLHSKSEGAAASCVSMLAMLMSLLWAEEFRSLLALYKHSVHSHVYVLVDFSSCQLEQLLWMRQQEEFMFMLQHKLKFNVTPISIPILVTILVSCAVQSVGMWKFSPLSQKK